MEETEASSVSYEVKPKKRRKNSFRDQSNSNSPGNSGEISAEKEEPKKESVSPWVDGRKNENFVALIRQMVVLATRAEEVFSTLGLEMEQVALRSERLASRLISVDKSVASQSCSNPGTLKIDSAGCLSRYTRVSNHFCSEKTVEALDKLFCASNRPPELQRAYRAAGRNCAPVAENTSTTSTQTTEELLDCTSKKKKKETTAAAADRGKRAKDENDAQRTSVVFDAHSPLPTPEQQTSSIASIYKSTVVAVDTSGANLKRILAARGQHFLRKTESLEYAEVEKITIPQESYCENSRRKKLRGGRRNTVAITSLSPLKEKSSNWMENDETPEAPISPIYDDLALEEPKYDVLPFQKRRSRFMPTNPFSSLRRPSKKAAKRPDGDLSVIYGSLRRHPVSTEVGAQSTKSDSVASKDGVVGEFKRFIQRSVSLRLSKRKRTTAGNTGEGIYDDLPIPKKVEDGLLNPNSGGGSSSESDWRKKKTDSLKRKLSLPISTTSQVLHLATRMREVGDSGRHSPALGMGEWKPKGKAPEAGGRRAVRPPSLISTSSNMSLDLLNDESGCYRQGYQLDFPEECIRISSPIQEENLLEKSTIPGGKGIFPLEFSEERTRISSSSSGHSSPKDSLGDSASSDPDSVAGDSNYSCDQEGYFTSMHRDSGLRKTAGKNSADFRGRSFSTHSSSSTVAEQPEDMQIRPSSSGDSGAEDLQSPIESGGSWKSRNFFKELGKISKTKAFPPLCEISLSGSERNSPQLVRSPMRKSLPAKIGTGTGGRARVPAPPALPPRRCKPVAEVCLDDWLLKKFEKELNLKNSTSNYSSPEDSGYYSSLPRRRPEDVVNSDFSVSGKKAVRFCE